MVVGSTRASRKPRIVILNDFAEPPNQFTPSNRQVDDWQPCLRDTNADFQHRLMMMTRMINSSGTLHDLLDLDEYPPREHFEGERRRIT